MVRCRPWKRREPLAGLSIGPATALVEKSIDPELAFAHSLFSAGDGNDAGLPPWRFYFLRDASLLAMERVPCEGAA